MGIVEKLTPTQFRVSHYRIDDDGLTTFARVIIFNAAGEEIFSDTTGVTWSAGELTAIRARLDAKKAAYAAATGLTELIP